MLTNELGVSSHSTTEEDWIKAAKNGNAVVWKKNAVVKNQVPDVTGMTFRDAIYVLEKSGLSVTYQGKGRVAHQSISPGAKFSRGSRIYLRLS